MKNSHDPVWSPAARRHLAMLALALFVAGCSAGAAPVATSQNDPSNPDAPQGAPIDVAARFTSPDAAPVPSAAPAGHDHHHGHQPPAPPTTSDAGGS